jgi:hypothetical protein
MLSTSWEVSKGYTNWDTICVIFSLVCAAQPLKLCSDASAQSSAAATQPQGLRIRSLGADRPKLAIFCVNAQTNFLKRLWLRNKRWCSAVQCCRASRFVDERVTTNTFSS